MVLAPGTTFETFTRDVLAAAQEAGEPYVVIHRAPDEFGTSLRSGGGGQPAPLMSPSRNPLRDASILSGKCSMDRVSTVFAEMPDWPRLFASSLCCWAKLQWQWRRFRCHGHDRLTFPAINLRPPRILNHRYVSSNCADLPSLRSCRRLPAPVNA